jgi:hypothetical protein
VTRAAIGDDRVMSDPLPSRAVAVRVTALVVAVLAVLAGSLWGEDDAFPIGPFRMYASSGRVNGNVRTATLTGVRANGRESHLQASSFGLRRAEFEGQFARFRRHPELLGDLADYYEGRRGVHFVELRLEEKVRRVVDGTLQPGFRREVVAVWTE